MKICIFLLTVLFFSLTASSQTTTRLTVVQDTVKVLNASVKVSKLPNNITEDSVLSTDVNGNLKLKSLSALASVEKTSNKVTSLSSPGNTTYPTTQAVVDATGIKGNTVFNANGTSLTFSIPHGLGQNPSWIEVQAGSGNAKGFDYITSDATNIYVNYSLAPPAGTGNVKFYWRAVK